VLCLAALWAVEHETGSAADSTLSFAATASSLFLRNGAVIHIRAARLSLQCKELVRLKWGKEIGLARENWDNWRNKTGGVGSKDGQRSETEINPSASFSARPFQGNVFPTIHSFAPSLFPHHVFSLDLFDAV